MLDMVVPRGTLAYGTLVGGEYEAAGAAVRWPDGGPARDGELTAGRPSDTVGVTDAHHLSLYLPDMTVPRG